MVKRLRKRLGYEPQRRGQPSLRLVGRVLLRQTLAIYQKSKDLPEEKAREVIDFIDFLKTRIPQADETGAREEQESLRSTALAQLADVRVHWNGKPIPNRDALYDDGRG